MIKRLFFAATLAVSTAVPFASIGAQPSSLIPGLHLSFTTPSGTVYQNSSIDIFVTLALDAGAPPFIFDGNTYDPSSPTPFGIPASTLPTDGFTFDDGTPETFAPNAYDAAFLFLVVDCNGTTFFLACPDQNGPPYDFTFGDGLGVNSETFSMAPGTSMSFLLGTLTPTGGLAPVGTYMLGSADIVAQVDGQDAAGDEIFGFTDGLVNACDNALPSCAFTRSVVPAPEPATFSLFGLGLGFVGLVRRRRARA
jgi:hypothetical protein